jgi:protein O-GlcNAc transferase
VFCCFNNNYKIEPRIFDVWTAILNQVPGSVLWLFSRGAVVEANLRREAAARELDPARLVFAAHRPKAEHLARHRLADLFLDTYYVNAHTTASDALWAGLPLVTCPGATFASRVAASLLHAIGLPELVTADLAHYERLAVELARSPDKLTQVRRKLAEHRTTWPLFDTPRFVRNLERAYQAMWQVYASGQSPQPLVIAEPTAPA